MSNAFLCALAAAVCIAAAIERPDRYMFWCVCAYFCEAALLIMVVTA